MHHKKHNLDSQAGVSLMLSVLVLAAITAISFSLATIVFIELRASGDVARSEPSLYATLGITEEALFQYKRFVNERSDGTTVATLDVETCFPQKQGVCDLGGVTFDANQDVTLLDYDEPTKIQTVLAGEKITLPLFDDVNNYDAVYKQIALQIIPANHNRHLGVKIRRVSEVDGTTDYAFDGTLYEGSEMTRDEMNIPHYQYDLILDNTQDMGNNFVYTPENFLVSIKSTGVDGQPKGLPFIGRKVLKVVADHLGITRTYLVDIPVGGSPQSN